LGKESREEEIILSWQDSRAVRKISTAAREAE
jgi:hypothetical protein